MKKNKRRKNSPLRFPMILAGLFLIVLSFVFSLKGLVDEAPRFEQQQENQQLSNEAFIERLVPHAQTLQRGYGILPSIIIGQAILESNWGKSELSSKYNNLFGIKSFGHSDFVTLDTQEYVNGQWITIQGDFRVYQTWEESMDDHTMLFVNGVDWSPQKYEAVLTAPSYKEAAIALQEAGYATDPTYAEKVIQVIEAYDLAQYD
ncbi:N-acetylmuramoyl-L-alanine amidase [Enterococcus alcedinis]|uniref:N-acetylmuramoyl-L-alanine amidase n=2 Tax=Enterococcus alcedinis TaxID=1274384 RepID=A0A917N3L8_9ENTE|nr:glycoside hydrolase family 73 protein [Enterococcus alcedinis]MBP2101135.1 flagellum-specific peptidoglycan hydrolase FlgJ [Enterococcus alcedinis]GGI64566.1 N-acetylmuramoyl-L-alanine amidase [Enterococcus alcedinis]